MLLLPSFYGKETEAENDYVTGSGLLGESRAEAAASNPDLLDNQEPRLPPGCRGNIYTLLASHRPKCFNETRT